MRLVGSREGCRLGRGCRCTSSHLWGRCRRQAGSHFEADSKVRQRDHSRPACVMAPPSLRRCHALQRQGGLVANLFQCEAGADLPDHSHRRKVFDDEDRRHDPLQKTLRHEQLRKPREQHPRRSGPERNPGVARSLRQRARDARPDARTADPRGVVGARPIASRRLDAGTHDALRQHHLGRGAAARSPATWRSRSAWRR